MPPMKLALRGNAAASTGSAQWNLTGDINANAFASDGTANFAGTQPAIKAQARFDALDINTLLPPPKAGPACGSRCRRRAPTNCCSASAWKPMPSARCWNWPAA